MRCAVADYTHYVRDFHRFVDFVRRLINDGNRVAVAIQFFRKGLTYSATINDDNFYIFTSTKC